MQVLLTILWRVDSVAPCGGEVAERATQPGQRWPNAQHQPRQRRPKTPTRQQGRRVAHPAFGRNRILRNGCPSSSSTTASSDCTKSVNDLNPSARSWNVGSIRSIWFLVALLDCHSSSFFDWLSCRARTSRSAATSFSLLGVVDRCNLRGGRSVVREGGATSSTGVSTPGKAS